MDGPFDPRAGHRYNPNVYLLDPYAKAFRGDIHLGTMKCVAARDEMDWTDDVRPQTPMQHTIIYETHVRGLTVHPSSAVSAPGTYKGLIDKIPYLKDLGVTAVELLPISEFGESMLGRCSISGTSELRNYWGYSSIGFFAPTWTYASTPEDFQHLQEFRDMVQACHEAGMEVILDVVFNHTSEGNELGPTLSFRGIDNSVYYLLDEDGEYLNYSGCGNTVSCNHPLVRDYIMDCLRYWVAVMHIDGFRFDLAAILGRNMKGEIGQDAPLIGRIAEDAVLRDTKLIAEAWDAGGGYLVGSFGDKRWAEWNGRYRDDVRRYWRGDPGTRGGFASRITGSSDLYHWTGRSPEHTINFITCHDGFTLRDLVSYKRKHNEANGEGNRDGSDDNLSMNFGVEGDTDNPGINALRLRMQKNYIATLFLSLGVPMLLGGDEFGRTQQGNNNAYCQDNEISWYDWGLIEQNQELFRFTREIIAFRKQNPVFQRATYFAGSDPNKPEREPDLEWFSDAGGAVDWNSPRLALACRIGAEENGGTRLYLMFNSTDRRITFQVPPGEWSVTVDTSRSTPHDILRNAADAPTAARNVRLEPKSMAVLSQGI
jgi:isoamylase